MKLVSVARQCSSLLSGSNYTPPEPFTFVEIVEDEKAELRAQVALRRDNIISQTLALAAQEGLLNYTQEMEKPPMISPRPRHAFGVHCISLIYSIKYQH